VAHDLATEKSLDEAREEGEPPIAESEESTELIMAAERASPMDGG
jgi:hypothetical protein